MTSNICFVKFWKFPQRVHSPRVTPKPNCLDVSLGGGREGASLKMEVNINVFFRPTGLIQAVIKKEFCG